MSSTTQNISALQQFYQDKTILITGSTGFLGTILLEKLLRSFPGIKKIFIIIRGKRGKTSQARMETYFESPVFHRVRKECPTSLLKVVSLDGDATIENFGLQFEDIEMILNEVNLVIHGAATIKFNELLKVSINVNIRGTLNILNISKRIKNLQCFVHISTLYVNCHNPNTDETIYPQPIAPEKLIDLVDSLDDEMFESIAPFIIGKWPNSYMFTKCAAENLVYAHRDDIPIAIFRPGLITAPYKEPLPGWINKYMGPYPYLTAVGLGLSKVIYVGYPDANSNIIPCDYVAHGIIALMWDRSSQSKNMEVSIVNYCPTVNTMTFDDLRKQFLKNVHKAPFVDCIWYPMNTMEKSMLLFTIYNIFLQRLPAYILDLFALLQLKKTRYVKLDTKLTNSVKESQPGIRHLKFEINNIYNIMNKLSDADRRILSFDARTIPWDDYCTSIPIGIKYYLLKEPMTEEATRKAKVKHFWLNVLDKAVKCAFLFIFIYIIKHILYKFI